jgi:hypothetical protein
MVSDGAGDIGRLRRLTGRVLLSPSSDPDCESQSMMRLGDEYMWSMLTVVDLPLSTALCSESMPIISPRKLFQGCRSR